MVEANRIVRSGRGVPSGVPNASDGVNAAVEDSEFVPPKTREARKTLEAVNRDVALKSADTVMGPDPNIPNTSETSKLPEAGRSCEGA
jgi:hypothetical protein